jgi:hypothetical protein
VSGAAILALLLASGGGRYHCVASERIEPGTWAVFQSNRLEDGGGELPSFHIRYMAKGEGAITQQMEWYDVPRWNEHLDAPDTIAFSIPLQRVDRKGFLRFSADGRSRGVPQERPVIHDLRPSGLSWVEFQGYSERNKFWKGSAWTVEAVDRSDRVRGSTSIRMPGPARVQEAYARLRVDLAKFEANPRKYCEYAPPPAPEDFPRGDWGIT